MPVGDRLSLLPRLAQTFNQVIRVESADGGLATFPRHLGARAVMEEVVASQLEVHPTAVGRNHDPPELVQKFRLAVGGKSHHFVFVPVLREAQVLRERGIENSQRMRKRDRAHRLDLATAPHTPHRAGEVAESVKRKYRRLLERRHEKRAREMRPVMLYAANLDLT